MKFRINVTRFNNDCHEHWFRVDIDNVFATDQTIAHVKHIADQLRTLPDASKVDVTRWETTGQNTSL